MIDKYKLLADMHASAKAACEAAAQDIVKSIDGVAEQQAEFIRVAWTAAAKVVIEAAAREIVADAVRKVGKFPQGGEVSK
jgi:hypothetical protein